MSSGLSAPPAPRSARSGPAWCSRLHAARSRPQEPRSRTDTLHCPGSRTALLTVVNAILDFSKIEAGKLDLEIIDCDVGETAEEVADLLAEAAHSKGLELLISVELDGPTLLRGDPGRLRQILINLVGNAIKFTEQGEVVVRARLVEDASDTALIRFEVVDTGIGIHHALQAGLFEPFCQADGSTSRRYGGSGLALAISKQLAELMGGQIGVESERGAGSTFWFTVRLDKVARSATVPCGPRPTLAEFGPLRVLVVDDNATNRKILNRQLTAWGIQSIGVEDGPGALAHLSTATPPFDVVILDMQMPGMDGLALAHAIKADLALRTTPLILLTSMGLRGLAEQVRRAGIAACLSKPVRPAHLHNCLTAVMHASSDTPSGAAGGIRDASLSRSPRGSLGRAC